MRLHRLEVTAFGPFPGTEEIDFDELNDAGLFLLTGPTGAGKTSILDAICFALYGQVPGVRGVKALKSQHAAPEARPEVVLDFSIRDRRFVVRRTPEWSRPKRRGPGSTDEKASATLVETTNGAEHFLSSRAQEVGHQIGELVGMHATQFVQVAMLPQGEFQRFLRASSQDRHDVLQRLFKTDRFARIEDWVHDHSRRLRERSSSGEGQVQRILDTIADRAGVTLPDPLSGDGLAAAASSGEVLSWATGLREDAGLRLDDLRRQHVAALEAVASARAEHEDAQRASQAVLRRDGALRALAALAEEESAEQGARDALEADHRAGRCTAVLRMLDDAVRETTRTRRQRDSVLASLAPLELTAPVSVERLADVERTLRARITRLEALLPREQALAVARQAVTSAEAALAQRGRLLAEVRGRLGQLPVQRADLEAQVARAAAAARPRAVLEAELVRSRERLAAARLVPVRRAELAREQDADRDARDRAADARQVMQDVVARRLAGFAAELAGRLQEGAACQVCGSTDHPSPAVPAGDAVTEADQDDATAAFDRLQAGHRAATDRVAEAQRLLDVARQASGDFEPEDAEASVSDLEARLAEAEEAEREATRLEELLKGLLEEADDLGRRSHALETETVTLEHELNQHRKSIADMASEIADALGDESREESLGTVLERLRRTLHLVVGAGADLDAAESADRRRADLEEQAASSTAEQGFASVDDARRAALDPQRRPQLERLLAERAESRTRAELPLEDPDVRSAGDRPAPDVALAAQDLAAAEETERSAARALHQQEQLVASLRTNLVRLDEASVAWSPVREDFVRADAMSKLVRGMGVENHLQMRLSSYVLATRLDQVVAAANERLGHLRDQRYLLQRTDRAARRGSQAGLGLEVVDEWTGDVRDPSSLSGGETFVVSLSLALGLADVVTQEAGGTEIETLFIDEGFGMLDADTLDDVMDRLDGLRAGGRTVGVVSHVAEIRNRIPTQVHVEKRRNGSSVAVRTMVA
jgi:exonuclease SbcC